MNSIMNDRRRVLNNNIEYIFTANQTSFTAQSGENAYPLIITSTANGENCEFEIISYDDIIKRIVKNNAGYYVIVTNKNSTLIVVTGNIVFKQLGSNNTLTITVTVNPEPISIFQQCILLYGTTNVSTGIILPRNSGLNIYTQSITTVSKPDFVDVTYTMCNINSATGYYVNVNALENNTYNIRTGTITILLGSRLFTIDVVQLPKDYLYRLYVTIGNINWGISNIGADGDIFNHGNYYQWGAGSITYQSGVNQYYTGSETILPSSADTATQVIGSGWRMPTGNEIHNLLQKPCYLYRNGDATGIIFIDNGNAVLFPSSGTLIDNNTMNSGSIYIWSSQINNSKPYLLCAYFTNYDRGDGVYITKTTTTLEGGYNLKNYGKPVRGVYN